MILLSAHSYFKIINECKTDLLLEQAHFVKERKMTLSIT